MPGGRVSFSLQGKTCNMAKPSDVASIANYARDEMGYIDLWLASFESLRIIYTRVQFIMSMHLVLYLVCPMRVYMDC